MASSTYYPSPAPAGHHGAAGKPTDGFLKRLMSRFETTHDVKARRQASAFVSIYSDEQLASYGWSARDIAILRAGAAD